MVTEISEKRANNVVRSIWSLRNSSRNLTDSLDADCFKLKASAVQSVLHVYGSLKKELDSLGESRGLGEKLRKSNIIELWEKWANTTSVIWSSLFLNLNDSYSENEMKNESKKVTFHDVVQVTTAINYRRKSKRQWMNLSTVDKIKIRLELNRFKMTEMTVHPQRYANQAP